MREIIVGRQLGQVEQRLVRLEKFTQSGPVPLPESDTRIDEMEAQFEATRDAMQHQVDRIRLEFSGEMAHRKQEARRLAEQIQQAAQAKSAPPATVQDVTVVEQRLVSWVADWQKSVEQHLAQREVWLIGQFREELARIRQSSSTAEQTTSQQELAREQIVTASQALAAAATALSQLTSSFSSPS